MIQKHFIYTVDGKNQGKKPLGKIFPNLSIQFFRFFCLRLLRAFRISFVFHPRKSRIFVTFFYYFGASCYLSTKQLSPKKLRVSFLALIVLKSPIFSWLFSVVFPFYFLGLFSFSCRGDSLCSLLSLSLGLRLFSSNLMLMLWCTLINLSNRKLLLTVPSSRGVFFKLEYRYILAGFFWERRTSVFDRMRRSAEAAWCGFDYVFIGFSSL